MLIKESLNFERGQSPKASMGVGKVALIKAWLDEMGVENYTINPDFNIDVKGDVDLSYKNLKNFPYFIQFGKIEGSFTCYGNGLLTLKGGPRYVKKNFYCSRNKLLSLEGAPSKVGKNFICVMDDIEYSGYIRETPYLKSEIQYACDVEGLIYLD